jgi:predicted AlkP superfamily phosphohydrolase/phosphomutase
VPEPEEEVGTLRATARRLPEPVKAALKGVRSAVSEHGDGVRKGRPGQPALRYRHHWPRMPAFALPSFYDGRIRVNLKGRERHGMVDPSRYDETCRELEAILRECRDPRTGEPILGFVERPWTKDPLRLTGSEADLVVVWRGVAAALEHPRLGRIGPVPLRRTGGHTGPRGVAWVAAAGIQPGDRGVRSSFDVVPTVARLMGSEPPAHVSGTSLL